MDRQAVVQRIEQAAAEQWEDLDLAGLELTELPPEIGQLRQLKRLILGKWDNKNFEYVGNQLRTLPPEIGQLQQLEVLNLSRNQLTTLPEAITQLTALQSLFLNQNKLRTLPEAITQLTALQSLFLNQNKLRTLPEAITQLTALRSLVLSYNQLTTLPEAITQLTALQELDLRANQLTTLPEAITQLTALQSLVLSDNQLTTLPEAIGQMTALRSLVLSYNQLTTLPEAITQLTALQSLHLRQNQLTTLPEAITQLTALQSLHLSYNQLTTLPEAIGQLTALQSLHLSYNQLTTLPEAIGQLTALHSLDLSDNQLTTLPEAIGQLTALKSLGLSDNQLTTLPEAIGQLTALQSLGLSQNQLTTLPEAIGQLTALQELDLSDNQLTTLPEAIAQLVNLKRLVLEDTPIANVPPEILRKGWGTEVYDDGDPQAIFAYLKATAKRPLNELKILLVGEGDVGKTSLLKRLLGQPFDAQELKTPGINIERWRLPQGDPNLRLNLWDFGGQRVMHNTHQFFLTKRSLYLLVLDNRKNEAQNRIEYWLKLIETYGGNSPVIIVGNCVDEHPLDLKQRTLRKKYPQIKDFVATSCKTGTGIAELCQAIGAQIDQIPHVRDLLPNEWFDLKTQLEQMQATYDFISYEKYQDLCQVAGITTAPDQKRLIEFLHDLGIVLHFQDEQYTWLQETNVLNPEWVTSGVYDILNNHELMVQKKGILTLPELSTILKQPERYPTNKRPFLMGLMEKFELCFKLDGYKPDRYLISDLLPIDEPDVDAYERAPLHFQYHYDLLPSSIISRFIVRNHTLIYKTMRWRSGAVLTQDLTKALVRADEEDTFIAIKVQGSRASALLATIRTDFQKIHNTIPHLAVREFLVVREIQDERLTGREVPVDYNYLCDLDRQGTVETALPNLKGKYTLRDLLEGVESRDQRQSNLDDRLARSYSSRDSRPLQTLPPQKPGLFKVSALMLGILAIVAAVFVAIVHAVPGLSLAVTVIAILLTFSMVVIFSLQAAGIITEASFNQGLAGFFKAIPILKGKEPTPPEPEASKQLPTDPKSKE